MKLLKELKNDNLFEIRTIFESINKIVACESCNLASRCCDAGYVQVLPIEIDRYKKLSIPVIELDGVNFLKRMNGQCMFFSKEKKICEIYDERPIICRLFPLDLSYEDGKLVWSYFSECHYLNQNYKSQNVKNILLRIINSLERYFNKELFEQFWKTSLVYPRLVPHFINTHQYEIIRSSKYSPFLTK